MNAPTDTAQAVVSYSGGLQHGPAHIEGLHICLGCGRSSL